jgi:hypothetical protein
MTLKIGDYVTVGGDRVRILCVDVLTGTGFQAVGLMRSKTGVFETVHYWHLDGSFTNPHSLDCKNYQLVDPMDFFRKSLKLDDPVEVKDRNGRWKVAHFARQTIAGIEVWVGGMTSKTVPSALKSRSTRQGAVEYLEFRPA